MYRCEATSISGFIQQLAVAYVRNGYWFYVCCHIPETKDPSHIDQKLVEHYNIGRPRSTIARHKKAGKANVQYLRYKRRFVLIATRGEHRFFAEESFQDIRRVPLRIFGYSIGYRKGADGKYHASVRIEEREWKRHKTQIIEHCTQRTPEALAKVFGNIPYEPYAPVTNQVLTLYRAVNRKRKRAGLEEVPFSCLRLRRRPVQPFAPSH